jgi:hypothetical protein
VPQQCPDSNAGMEFAEAQAPQQQQQQQQQQPVAQASQPAVLPTAAQHPAMLSGPAAVASQPQMTPAQFLAGLPPQHQAQVLPSPKQRGQQCGRVHLVASV